MQPFDGQSPLGRIHTLRPGNTGEAIHALPDIGGNLFYIGALIPYFAADRPILGLTLPPLNPKALAAETMETLAERTARALEDALPGRRHHLLGHSFAGLLAYETARALHRLGARPGLVAILDTGVPPGGLGRAASQLRYFAKRILGRIGPHAAGVLASPGYATFDLRKHPAAYRDVIASLYGAMVRYRPAPYSGSVTVFRSAANGIWAPMDLGWSRLAKGGVVIVNVDGDHLAMVRRSECARTVASSIEHILRNTNAAGAW